VEDRVRVACRVLVLVGLLAPAGLAQEAPPPAARRLGETVWIGEQPLRSLGPDEAGRERWLYPHIEGVPEVLVDPGDGGLWEGWLGSRFSPQEGFLERWNCAHQLSELMADDVERAQRPRIARRLALFLALHPAPEGPYYLRDTRRTIERLLEAEDQAWVAERRLEQAALLAALEPVEPVSAPRVGGYEDYYEALLADGYLDLVVVGGNSRDEVTGDTHSWGLVRALGDELVARGFERVRLGRADEEDGALCERTVTLRGRQVRVRVRLSGGSHRPRRIRQAIAGFVDGLACADVVVYVGHSNHDSGTYYLDETKSSASRFRIGRGARASDLRRRCHQLGTRYQLLLLQSCASYAKYCQPVASIYRDLLAEGEASCLPGLLGTTGPCYYEEFLPRCEALLDLLLRCAGPEEIAQRLETSRPRGDASRLVLRGVLQPRGTFVTPPGVSVVDIAEQGEATGFLVEGRGSDGLLYHSSCVFPQDQPGDVVQVAAWADGLYGLRRDGRLERVGPETSGVAVEVSWALDLHVTWVASLDPRGPAALFVLDAEGAVHTLNDRSGRLDRPVAPPAGVRLTALGVLEGRLAAVDAEGQVYARSQRRWELVDPDLARALELAPSLAVEQAPGVLTVPLAAR
jgi:hypothetical protein